MRKLRGNRGFTLLELTIAMAVIVFGIFGLLSAISFTSRSNAVNRENDIALRGAQQMIETLRGYDVAQLFARFNTTTADDIATPPNPTNFHLVTSGGAPRAMFTVEGLDLGFPALNPAQDPDGPSGEIIFPGDGTKLAEVSGDPIWQDLDADGVTGETDVSGDFNLLPITLVIRWKSVKGGVREVRYRYTLMNPSFTYPTGSP
jgi:prepilin-type N-terminal cleavage/methylation domain-containing protein